MHGVDFGFFKKLAKGLQMSSNSPIIRVENLSKCFNIYDRPRDRLKEMFMSNLPMLSGSREIKYHREFWALDNINFEIGKGQTVGILGQNGSGKSTLLQIMTGTMTPTSGTVNIDGKVAALLELGSGFNPDFTGRENVYLNGSLLGLTRNQIDNKFDYIASFADIGDHLDQPVKTYSSGMMLRLAFAVQIAVESEVLIIDEALAVGDARFQMKCFKRLEELKALGTTILFVSHSSEQIRSFCDFGLVLDKGKTIFWGDARAATVKYLASIFPDQTQPEDTISNSTASSMGQIEIDELEGSLSIKPNQEGIHTFGVGGARLEWMKVEGVLAPNLIVGGSDIKIECQFSWDIEFVNDLINSENYEPNIAVGIALADKKGSYIFGCNGYDSSLFIDSREDGIANVTLNLTLPYLAIGDYFLTVAISIGTLDYHIQLKWYDYLLQLNYIDFNKKVFGILGVDYQMARVSTS